jgi:hypothetical protein
MGLVCGLMDLLGSGEPFTAVSTASVVTTSSDTRVDLQEFLSTKSNGSPFMGMYHSVHSYFCPYFHYHFCHFFYFSLLSFDFCSHLGQFLFLPLIHLLILMTKMIPLCEWEEDSKTPVLHITWAKQLVNSLSRFDPTVRKLIHLKSESGEESSSSSESEDESEEEKEIVQDENRNQKKAKKSKFE